MHPKIKLKFNATSLAAFNRSITWEISQVNKKQHTDLMRVALLTEISMKIIPKLMFPSHRDKKFQMSVTYPQGLAILCSYFAAAHRLPYEKVIITEVRSTIDQQLINNI